MSFPLIPVAVNRFHIKIDSFEALEEFAKQLPKGTTSWEGSRSLTITLLVIGAVAGLALISVGSSGLCISLPHLNQAACIAMISVGVPLMIPGAIALLVGLKKENDSMNPSSPIPPSVPGLRIPSLPSTPQNPSSAPRGIEQTEINENLTENQEIERCKRQVKRGHYAVFTLTSGKYFGYSRGWLWGSHSLTVSSSTMSKADLEALLK